MSGPSNDARARLLAAVQNEQVPTRAEHRRAVWLRSFVVVAVVVVAFFGTGGAHPGDRGVALTYGTAAGWLALAALGAWLAVARGRSMLGRPRGLVAVVALGLGPALLGWVALAGGLASDAANPGMGAHLACLSFALMFAAAPFLFIAWLRRESDPIHPRATGAALGAIAGAVGGVFIDLHCPATYVAHVLIGHVLPTVLLAGLGGALGPLLVGIRSPSRAPPR